MSERDIINEWLQIAYEDYDTAQYLFQKPHRKPLEIICYHCQQSAEKSLKAFLCANNINIPRTHETGVLCRQCVELDETFFIFIEPCEELAIFATETRYPIRIEVDEITVRRNLQNTFKLYLFVSNILHSELNP
ncbi:MAG: HEPN domain-containing protein [Clostridiales bacterium]|jgi:HEPN domain-containing protein|nr:HEPN domain-containing protein [Clostridiales bacterium]